MSRFYLHQQTRNGLIEDPDGTEAPNVAAARHGALIAARQLLANAILAGIAPLGSAFLIADESGKVLLNMPFKDAISESFLKLLR